MPKLPLRWLPYFHCLHPATNRLIGIAMATAIAEKWETMYRIKNWERFQHYQKGDRSPSWIKLYRSILDDMEWHELSGDNSKVLVMMWLIASENDGNLPHTKKLAFRLRMKESELKQAIKSLSPWLEQTDSDLLADCYQSACLEQNRIEEEREEEKEIEHTSVSDSDFDRFWVSCPRKVSKASAKKAWDKAVKKTSPDLIIEKMAEYASHCIAKGTEERFIKHPATWLNGGCWDDQLDFFPTASPPKKSDYFSTIIQSTARAAQILEA